MTRVGDIKKATEIGKRGVIKYIWHCCVVCGTARWVHYLPSRGGARSVVCAPCNARRVGLALKGTPQRSKRHRGPGNSRWRGGKTRESGGYVSQWVSEDSPYFSMASGGRVLEHRLVMAQHLGRCLEAWEVVHHVNGIPDDNRLENLELLDCQGQHNTMVNKQLKKQSLQIEELTRLVRLLLWQNTQLLKDRVRVEG